MSVEANVVASEKPGALLVPADALQGTAVFVLDGDRVRRRTVTLGIRGTRAVEILSGVSESDRVVAPIPGGLADRQRVRAADKATTP